MMAIETLNNACIYVAGKRSLIDILPELDATCPEHPEILSLLDIKNTVSLNLPNITGPDALLAFEQKDRGMIISFADHNRTAISSGAEVYVDQDDTGRVFLALDHKPK